MKVSSALFWAMLGAVAVVAGIFLWKQASAEGDRTAKQGIESWVEQRLAESLSKKLGCSAEEIRTVLAGQTQGTLTGKIERLVRSTNLVFSRQSPSTVIMHLQTIYQDGTQFSASIQKNWDDLPDDIRARFLQTAGPEIVVPWTFGWADTTQKNTVNGAQHK